MFKKSPSRNQRSKGIKTKNVLQICLLLGVCFWLIYQVKRSHDKRKEFDEKDAKASVKAQSADVILKFGRKDLPHVQDVSKNYKHKEGEEEEDGVEETNKRDEEQEEKVKRLEEEKQEGASEHEVEEQEEGSKHEEEEQEGASEHEVEEQEEGNKREEEEQEGASEHEVEEQEEGNKREEEEQEEPSKQEEEEEEEQEEVREDKGSNHEDEEQEAEIKDEEAEDEVRGDDEVNENEQEKVDGEADLEEEFLDEEKEREAEGDDKENEEKENEEKEGQEESDDLVNDGGDRNAHEAREKHYKADDASSAVSHDTQIINSEADKLEKEDSNDNSTMNVSEQENKANTTQETNGDENKSELKVDEGKHSEGDRSLNVTYTKGNDQETGSSNSVYISFPNRTNTTGFIDQASNTSLEVSKETGNNIAEVNTEIPGSLQNGTTDQNTTENGMVTEEKYKEQANEMISINKQPNSNTVDLSKTENVATDSSNSSTDAKFGMSEDIAKINRTAGGDGFGSSMTKEVTDSIQNEKSVGDSKAVGTDESSDNSSSNATMDGGQHDPIDSSGNTLPQDEKDARVDLSTLPDITTEGSNNKDAAAE